MPEDDLTAHDSVRVKDGEVTPYLSSLAPTGALNLPQMPSLRTNPSVMSAEPVRGSIAHGGTLPTAASAHDLNMPFDFEFPSSLDPYEFDSSTEFWTPEYLASGSDILHQHLVDGHNSIMPAHGSAWGQSLAVSDHISDTLIDFGVSMPEMGLENSDTELPWPDATRASLLPSSAWDSSSSTTLSGEATVRATSSSDTPDSVDRIARTSYSSSAGSKLQLPILAPAVAGSPVRPRNNPPHQSSQVSNEGSRVQKSRQQPRKRRTAEQLRQANDMRSIKSCSRCRKFNVKCDPGFPCNQCQAVALSVRSYHEPCYRDRLENAVTARHDSTYPAKRVSIGWILPGALPIQLPPIEACCRRYHVEDASEYIFTWTADGTTKTLELPPYGWSDQSEILEAVRKFIEDNWSNIIAYMERRAEDEISRLSLKEARRYATATGSDIVNLALRIRAATFFSASRGRLEGSETLGIPIQDYSSSEKCGVTEYDERAADEIPIPFMLKEQVDVAALLTIKTYQRSLLRKLQKLIFSKSKTIKPWYEIYLATYIAISNLENAHGEAFLIKEQIAEYNYSANNILHHFRYILRGPAMFKLAKERPTELRNRVELDEEAMTYMNNIIPLLREQGMSHIASIRCGNHLTRNRRRKIPEYTRISTRRFATTRAAGQALDIPPVSITSPRDKLLPELMRVCGLQTMTRSVPVPKLSSNLRLATPEDVMRIGVVATGGFRYSPIFQWMRPYHRIFPEDTVLSYRTEYLRALQNPNCVVLVALDKYDALENQKSEAIIPENDEYRPPVEGTEIVVGVASYRFQPNSERHGQFHYKDGNCLAFSNE
ncbi:hypothetical protein FH972_022990 [Carpinus fangiana]|uniref:Zn(2)-C6 fungal-type domain-containing protein n=1 Tax=Carpinus fangiana TaxID=176857 RepID=A0A5N6KUH2_9ROSI|nr:hypothetical protein FH972_022990 [Carpinus fangiana]